MALAVPKENAQRWGLAPEGVRLRRKFQEGDE
jgi:hypothetical protein